MEEDHCETNEEGICAGCFRRQITGAADVNNAKRRLEQCLKMQIHFLSNYEAAPKKPKTYATREKLRDFFEETLREFDELFKEQLPEYADPEEIQACRKRKRKD